MMKLVAYFVLAVAASLSGCSHVPPGPARPSLDPASAARAAMEQYDVNHDGKIDANELKQCPAMLEALEFIDADHDGALTVDEIAARMRQWKESPSIVVSGSTQVFLDGQPLVGATVTYEPEKFMGPAYQTASGVTDGAGFADFKGQDPKCPGLYVGFYRVRISKVQAGRELLPSRYNTETVLGKELGGGGGTKDRWRLRFDLQSQ